MKVQHTFLLTLVTLLLAFGGFAQENPVSFQVHLNEDTLIFDATIEPGWHLYAANLPDPTGGPLPTEIVYNDPAPETKGAIIEPAGHVEMDDAFGIDVKYFEKAAYYKQVLAKVPQTLISGTVYYMVCNDEMCIPLEYGFSVNP